MGGWSSLAPGSVLGCVETGDAYNKTGVSFSTDIDIEDGVNFNGDDSEIEQRRTFDQVLAVFLKELGARGIARPVPAVIGDSQSVDLFKLFSVVRDRGGYEWVSKNCLWSAVATELGLDRGAMASLKLIHFKYLNQLEKWFREGCKGRSLGTGESRLEWDSQLLSLELEKDFRGLLLDRPEQKVQSESDENGMVELNLSDANDAYRKHVGSETCNGDAIFCNDDRNDAFVVPSRLGTKENNRKRNRESLSGMLNWVVQIAKKPRDPSIGEIPVPTKWKEHNSDECWMQAIRAREALLLKRNVNPKIEDSLPQKKLKIHPLLYEDNGMSGQQSSERLRSRERLPNSMKARSCPCCRSCSAPRSHLISPHEKELDKNSKEKASAEFDGVATKTTVILTEDDTREKNVSVSPLSQADVSEWTDVASESDIKWLGTRVWPLQCEEDSSHSETDVIGRGRPQLCDCQLPGSVACVRFHITEARMKMKRELGSLFYHWRFDRMGEEVSLQWTAEEEKRFRNLVKSDTRAFWGRASTWFPKKRRENLVSYYFNVFLVQRRSYQNRVTPTNIDSDDNETEFGSFSDGFRHDAVEVSANFLPCPNNQQCSDFD